jgi:hypothetical protein
VRSWSANVKDCDDWRYAFITQIDVKDRAIHLFAIEQGQRIFDRRCGTDHDCAHIFKTALQGVGDEVFVLD